MPRERFLVRIILKFIFSKGQLLLGLLFLYQGAYAQIQSNTDEVLFSELAGDSIWLSQLQYRKTLLNNWKSDADSSFFISNNGKYDPVGELRATYELFVRNPEKPFGYINQPVVCAFPTRKKFLEEKLKIRFKEIHCEERDQWMKSFLGTQSYLVLSDAFPGNPASMFGHTFLLFSRHSPPASAKGLLDYAINFSADTSTASEKSLLYSLKGLFGYFPGRYRIYKFYEIANQYNNFDSRDIWYLKIPFTDQQLQRFLDHIWEIFTTTQFDYYFFDQNCSFRILAAFDYADPQLKLMDEFYNRFPLYYVAPLSTFRAVADRYNVTDLQFSPSIWKRVRKKVNSLSSIQYKSFSSFKNDVTNLNQESDVSTLDALALYFDYKKRTASDLTEDTLLKLRSTLVRRSEIEIVSKPEEQILPRGTPLESHRNKAAWIGWSQENAQSRDISNSAIFGARASYHDLLNPAVGYDTWSDLTALDFELHLTSKKAEFNFFKVINIRSLFPVEGYEKKVSWATDGGYDSVFKNYFKGGVGYAIQNKIENLLGYFYFMPLVSSNEILTESRGYTFLLEAGAVHDLAGVGRIWIYGLKNIGGSDSARLAVDSIVTQLSYPLRKNHELRLRHLLKSDDTALKFIYQLQF